MGKLHAADWTSYGFKDAQSFLFWAEKQSIAATISYVNFELERLYLVANRNGNGKGKGRKGGSSDGWKGFANINLTQDDKKALSQGRFDLTAGLEVIREMLATGHKISLSHRDDTGSVTASATGVGEDCPNKGYTLSAFARDVTDALAVLAYKHKVIAEGVWAVVSEEGDDSDFG